jgi:hypothetical protein
VLEVNINHFTLLWRTQTDLKLLVLKKKTKKDLQKLQTAP